ncbi:MAG: metallophosphoesterase family protein [Clostridia bacterium]|nr:metallophosphoesterase family protein [Clostridia bacterium]MBP3649784.1 metallophosphoesterase family protein [Clostridia bacterium]
MRYAVIADIHGNLLALDTILADAARQRVDQYLFAGDYCISHPQPNDCLNRIRNIANSIVIRGNDDQHLERLIGQDPASWTDGQMQATYWCHQDITPENRNWLFGLPHTAAFTDAGVMVQLAHKCTHFFEGLTNDIWSSIYVAGRYAHTPLTPALLQKDVQNKLDCDEDFQARFDALPDGVYLFAHTHVQWSYASKDGKRWLVNCGSCGIPLDGIVGSIPYAILEIAPDGRITEELRRVPLDIEQPIGLLASSDLALHAPVWGRLIEEEMRTGLEKVSFFIHFAETYAQRTGDVRRPFTVDTWEAAYQEWKAERLS